MDKDKDKLKDKPRKEVDGVSIIPDLSGVHLTDAKIAILYVVLKAKDGDDIAIALLNAVNRPFFDADSERVETKPDRDKPKDDKPKEDE